MELDALYNNNYKLIYNYIKKHSWKYIDELNQTEIMNKSFTGKIVIEGKQRKGQELLSTVIKNNNSPIVTTTPDFSTISTTDEGLIQGIDKDGETYYFRGAVEDNYVKFDGLKWTNTDSSYHTAGEDMLFRIVRINGDGTIRLIADGSVGQIPFNTTYNNEKYAGYTYDNSEPNKQDGTDSTIKTYLDSWYNTDMTSYDKYIANTRFCNDTTIGSTSGNTIYYGAYNRLHTNKIPSFICENTTKIYGGEYDLKVGLITADEISFAGGKSETINSSYYLYGKSDWFWTASPYHFISSAHVWFLSNYGDMFVDIVSGGAACVPQLI